MNEDTDLSDAPIGIAREGMKVLDSNGQHLGTVSIVQLSDPGVETSQGQEAGLDVDGRNDEGAVPPIIPPVVPGAGGVAGVGAGAPGGLGAQGAMIGAKLSTDSADVGTTEPEVPPSLAERLRRVGYLKVDSKGWFHRDLYVAADQIIAVDSDGVQLSTSKDELIKED
jgi:hypothetical protein